MTTDDDGSAVRRGRTRSARVFAWALLVGSGLWLGWGATTVLERAHDAARADLDPHFWRFWTRETLDLRAVLEPARGWIPPARELVVAAAPSSQSDGFEVALWTQFLAPHLDVHWQSDDASAVGARFRLRWNLPPTDGGWMPRVTRGRFVFEERAERP